MTTPAALPAPRHSARLGGATYVLASVGFLLVFAWLASHFGYPDVLDRPASAVLPDLLALGRTGRAVWAVYALLPLLLVPAVVAVLPALRHEARDHSAALLAVVLQVVSSLAMTLGLARWSTLQWRLAEAYRDAAGDADRAVIAATSDALNALLGNAMGEFVGELTLFGSFAALAVLLQRRGARWLAALAWLTAVTGWVAMFRNVTPAVDAASALPNTLLPLFLIVLGVWVIRRG